MKLLKKLSSDPGIIAVMKKHNWRVGLLREMPPEGKVGISEVCILGLNENKGQTISLRIRTDDLKGFRNYGNIKNVLLHELTHNQFSEHNDDFWMLFRQLQREAESLDWTKSRGHSLAGNHDTPGENSLSDSDEEDDGHRLGGDHPAQFLPVQELAGLAALARIEQVQPSTQSPPKVPGIFPGLVPDAHPNPPHVGDLKSQENETPMEVDEPIVEQKAKIPERIPSPVHSPISPPIVSREQHSPALIEIEIPVRSEKEKREYEEMISQDQQLAVMQEFVTLANQRIDAALTRVLNEAPEISRKSLLQTVYKIVSNILNFPNEEKYRKLALSSKVLQEKLLRFSSGLELLRTLGFREESAQLVYTRNDPGYLWIAKSKLEEYSN